MEEEKLYMTIGIEELAPEGPSKFQKRLTKIDSDSEKTDLLIYQRKGLIPTASKDYRLAIGDLPEGFYRYSH